MWKVFVILTTSHFLWLCGICGRQVRGWDLRNRAVSLMGQCGRRYKPWKVNCWAAEQLVLERWFFFFFSFCPHPAAQSVFTCGQMSSCTASAYAQRSWGGARCQGMAGRRQGRRRQRWAADRVQDWCPSTRCFFCSMAFSNSGQTFSWRGLKQVKTWVSHVKGTGCCVAALELCIAERAGCETCEQALTSHKSVISGWRKSGVPAYKVNLVAF